MGGASSRDPGSGSCMAAMRRIKARAEGSDVSVGSPGCLPWGSCHIGKVVTILGRWLPYEVGDYLSAATVAAGTLSSHSDRSSS